MAMPPPFTTPDPHLPVLHDLSPAGYLDFQSALDQARDMVTAHQHTATDPARTPAERTWAAQTAVNQQATIQLFAALVGDRTELDALYALDDHNPEPTPGSWDWTPAL